MAKVSLEKLDGDAIYLIRVYADDVEPVAPNPYKFTVAARVKNHQAELLGMCHSNVTPADYKSIKRQLQAAGVKKICWTHHSKSTVDALDTVTF
jgi:hypothetical protein